MEAAQRAAQGPPAVGELQSSHLFTDAQRYVQLSDRCSGNVARLVLDHPLDRDVPGTGGGFTGALGGSHGTVARVYQSEHIHPVEDPTVVLHGCTPGGYTDQKVFSMLTAIDVTVLRTQRLHEDISAPISSVLSTGESTFDHTPDPDNCVRPWS